MSDEFAFSVAIQEEIIKAADAIESPAVHLYSCGECNGIDRVQLIGILLHFANVITREGCHHERRL